MGILIVALIGLMFWVVKGAGIKNAVSTVNVGTVTSTDHVEGNRYSKISVVEYSDFECPACRNYYLVFKQLAVEYGDRVAFVYRSFPLTEIHQNAEIAAEAAEAADKQGKFWEMHNLLFEKQDEWASSVNPETLFESYATLLGLSVPQFKTDIASKEIADLVNSERAQAISLQLQGTPSFFVNGKQIQNPASVDAFKTIINDVLQNNKSVVK